MEITVAPWLAFQSPAQFARRIASLRGRPEGQEKDSCPGVAKDLLGPFESDYSGASVSSHLVGKKFLYEGVGLFEPGVSELASDFTTSIEAHNDQA